MSMKSMASCLLSDDHIFLWYELDAILLHY